jgi:hypothetical protein
VITLRCGAVDAAPTLRVDEAHESPAPANQARAPRDQDGREIAPATTVDGRRSCHGRFDVSGADGLENEHL